LTIQRPSPESWTHPFGPSSRGSCFKAPTANSKGLRLGSFDQIRAIIDEELEAVWAGDKDAQAALDSAVQRGNRLLRRFEQANQ
jgi:sn-glycerol 3-phosphate transport system substrate-binding protein